jgi:hypothetical protein
MRGVVDDSGRAILPIEIPCPKYPTGVRVDAWEKTKSSVPVLSAQKPWFSQGFSHTWPIALAFLPIHACPCLQVLRRLVRCLTPW